MSLAILTACSTTGESTPNGSTTPPTSTTTTTTMPPAASTTTTTAPTTTSTTTTSTTTTSTSPPTTTSTTTTTTVAPRQPGECVGELSVREQVALLVWPSVYSVAWDEAMATVRDTGVGGVLLMRPDGWSADELAGRLDVLEAASHHGLIVATDEEGGDVQRLRVLGELPAQRRVSQDVPVGEVATLIAGHGALVRSVGVDMVLGPVVDVEPNVGDVPLQPSRFFAGSPADVTAYAAAYIEGWDRADLFAVLKHFPGHGAASGDTHITAGVTPSFDDIVGWDLAPYRELRATAAAADVSVMLGHLTVPGLTDGVPATRSPAAVAYLRDDLGYGDALLMTDALGMAAVGLAEPEASVLALQAGIDVVIFTQTSQTDDVIDALVAAVDDGRIPAAQVEASAARVMRRLEHDGHRCGRPA